MMMVLRVSRVSRVSMSACMIAPENRGNKRPRSAAGAGPVQRRRRGGPLPDARVLIERSADQAGITVLKNELGQLVVGGGEARAIAEERQVAVSTGAGDDA